MMTETESWQTLGFPKHLTSTQKHLLSQEHRVTPSKSSLISGRSHFMQQRLISFLVYLALSSNDRKEVGDT